MNWCIFAGVLACCCWASAGSGTIPADREGQIVVPWGSGMDAIYVENPELMALLHDAGRMAFDAPALKEACQKARSIVEPEEVELFPGALVAWQSAESKDGSQACRVSPLDNSFPDWERAYWSRVNLENSAEAVSLWVTDMMQLGTVGKQIMACSVRLSALYEELALSREWLELCLQMREHEKEASIKKPRRDPFFLAWDDQEIRSARNRISHLEMRIAALEEAMRIFTGRESSSPVWHGRLDVYVRQAEVLAKRGQDRWKVGVSESKEEGKDVYQVMKEDCLRLLFGRVQRTREAMVAVEEEVRRYREFLASARVAAVLRSDRDAAFFAERNLLLLRMSVLKAVADYAALFPELDAELVFDRWH